MRLKWVLDDHRHGLLHANRRGCACGKTASELREKPPASDRDDALIPLEVSRVPLEEAFGYMCICMGACVYVYMYGYVYMCIPLEEALG